MNTVPLQPANSSSTSKSASRSLVTGKRLESMTASRLLILQGVIPLATNLVSSQLEAFSTRLADELFRLSDQAVRPEEAKISFDAHQLIKRNSSAFYRLVAGQINAELTKEVSVFNTKKKQTKEEFINDTTAQTYEQMESRILMRNASQSLEVISAEPLVMLNTLIGRLLNRMPVDITQNPFRPEIFVRAVFHAWTELDKNDESHLLVLRLLQPGIFFQLTPILEEINNELMARGVTPEGDSQSPNLANARFGASGFSSSDPYLQDKLQRIFAGTFKLEPNQTVSDEQVEKLERALLDLDGAVEKLGEHEVDETVDKAHIDHHFFEDLKEMQKAFGNADAAQSQYASNLRALLKTSSSEKLNLVERNTIELLARIFDYIFADQTLREDIKVLIAPLQIPILRVALLDKEFFFRESHPARTLMDILGSSGMILDNESTQFDPLLGVIGDVVERVQLEFEEHIDLFSDVVSDLEGFLKDEELKAQEAISEPVQTALNEEKMRIARECAAHDVAIRVETGEVAGFLETFLLEQWIRILTIAHSVKDEKPHALENALKTMDDLIWSLKPKNSADERKELIAKLPAMLTLLNAWLNAIRWDEPDRVLFFSKLAERHASMARAPLELSPRRQLEIAVNIAQRASNRRLDRFVQSKIGQEEDEAKRQVDELERGMWLDFTRPDEQVYRFKLAWISPKRTSFIFTNRQGYEAFSISAEDLVNQCREGLVTTIMANSLVDRALAYALRELPL